MQKISNQTFKAKHLSDNKFVSNKMFLNCIFEKCNLSEYRFTNCHFEDCIFRDCNFKNAFLALNEKYESGSFIRCQFITCKLKATSFRFPIIENCEFRNCQLDETNFDGSRFSNTKFIGELDSCFFRGFSHFAKLGSLFSFSKIDPTKLPNKMINVDFSSAKLVGLTFSHKIDLSDCIFPTGEEYIFVKNREETVRKAIDIIQETWSDDQNRETAIELIKVLYDNEDMQGQKNTFIDIFIHKETDAMAGNNVGVSVFNLIKKIQGH